MAADQDIAEAILDEEGGSIAPAGEIEEGGEGLPVGLESAGADVIAAVKSGDPKKVGSALRYAFQMCMDSEI